MPKKYNYTKKTGRPSLYKPEFCDEIIKFFDIPKYKKTLSKRVTSKSGDVTEYFENEAEDLRFLSQFARSIGVSTFTLNEWCKTHKEFSNAYTMAKEMQLEHLAVNALQSNYNAFFSVMTAKNIFGWRDQQVDKKVDEELINNELDFSTVPKNGDGKERLKQYFN